MLIKPFTVWGRGAFLHYATSEKRPRVGASRVPPEQLVPMEGSAFLRLRESARAGKARRPCAEGVPSSRRAPASCDPTGGGEWEGSGQIRPEEKAIWTAAEELGAAATLTPCSSRPPAP